MLNFVKNAFRGGLEIILWINLIAFTIGGGIIGNALSYRNNHTFLGVIIGIIVGLLINIFGGGFIATIINIDENIEQLKYDMKKSMTSFNSSSEKRKKCKSCWQSVTGVCLACPDCGGTDFI